MGDGGGGDGGDGGGKGGGSTKGGGGGSTGFTPTGGGPTTVADNITAGPAAPMTQLAGGTFSPGGGSPIDITGTGGTPAPWNASLTDPLGANTTGGVKPTPGTTAIDALGVQGGAQGGAGAGPVFAGGTGAPTATTPLTPEQMGAPVAGAKPAAPAGGDKSVLESLGVKSPVGAAIGAAGLGYSILQGQQAAKFSPEMEAQARSLNAQGQQLLSYLNSGNLPPGLKASLDQATSSAKAKIISNFAAQGLNTDPTQNTALAAQLAQVDQQALISTAQIGQQLMQSGLAETGLSSDLYKTLSNIDQTQTANIGKAIANFASAASGGGGGGINLKVA